MVLINGESLIISSSGKIKFFMRETNLLMEALEWTLYHTINSRGSIYYIKDTDRFQITTIDYVYFYFIDL